MKKLLLICLFLIPLTANAALIREWLFEETSGGTAADTSGSNDTLTFTGCTQGVIGRTGYGVQTTATSNRAVPTLTGLGINGLSEYTLDFDIYLTVIPDNPTVGVTAFWEDWNGADRNVWAGYFHAQQPNVRWDDAIGNQLNYNFILSSGVWYNIALVFKKNDAAGQKYYITQLPNVVGTAVASGASANANVPTATGTGWYFQSYELDRCGKAIWDNLRLYDTALTQSELDAVVNPVAPAATYKRNVNIIIH
jgi:hypothetical protein